MNRSLLIVQAFLSLGIGIYSTNVKRQPNPTSGVVSCPHLFHENANTGTCYKVVRIAATWPEALAYCEAYNSELAIIESADEQRYLESVIKSDGGNLSPPRFWLGGADVMSEGEWLWAITREKVSYTNWDANQPSNNDGREHCMETDAGRQYRWNDEDCENKLYFVCETMNYRR